MKMAADAVLVKTYFTTYIWHQIVSFDELVKINQISLKSDQYFHSYSNLFKHLFKNKMAADAILNIKKSSTMPRWHWTDYAVICQILIRKVKICSASGNSRVSPSLPTTEARFSYSYVNKSNAISHKSWQFVVS